MAVVGDAWGTREEMLHPRDSHGRFRSKWKMAISVVDKLMKMLGSFNPKTFGNDQEAGTYVQSLARSARPGAGSHAALGKFLRGTQTVQAALRRGDTSGPDVKGMDNAMAPLPDDLILSRVVGPEAFGLAPENIGQIEEYTGHLVADKGYAPTTIGTPLPHAGPAITITIATPAGTRAAIPQANSPHREVVLDRDQPLRITKVDPDGKGGFYVLAVATEKGGVGQKRPTKLGGKAPTPEPGLPEPGQAPSAPPAPGAPVAPGAPAPVAPDANAPVVAPLVPQKKIGRPAGPPPAPRNDGHVAEAIGGKPVPQTPQTQEGVPQAAPEPIPQQPGLPKTPPPDARSTFRGAFKKADLTSPSEGKRRQQFNEAYLGAATGKKTPQEAVDGLEHHIALNEKILAGDKEDGTDSGPLPDDIKKQKALVQLIKDHFQLEGASQKEDKAARKAAPTPKKVAPETPKKESMAQALTRLNAEEGAKIARADAEIARGERERKAAIRKELRSKRESAAPTAPAVKSAPRPKPTAKEEQDKTTADLKHRQEMVDRRRPYVKVLQDFDFLTSGLGGDVDNETLAERIEQAVDREIDQASPDQHAMIRNEVGKIAKDVRAGKMAVARRKVTQLMGDYDLELGPRAGKKTKFDPKEMKLLSGKAEPGDTVTVNEPAVIYRHRTGAGFGSSRSPSEPMVLERAVVFVDEPAAKKVEAPKVTTKADTTIKPAWATTKGHGGSGVMLYYGRDRKPTAEPRRVKINFDRGSVIFTDIETGEKIREVGAASKYWAAPDAPIKKMEAPAVKKTIPEAPKTPTPSAPEKAAGTAKGKLTASRVAPGTRILVRKDAKGEWAPTSTKTGATPITVTSKDASTAGGRRGSMRRSGSAGWVITGKDDNGNEITVRPVGSSQTFWLHEKKEPKALAAKKAAPTKAVSPDAEVKVTKASPAKTVTIPTDYSTRKAKAKTGRPALLSAPGRVSDSQTYPVISGPGYKDMTPDERKKLARSISQYRSNFYSEINSRLRGEKPRNPHMDELVHDIDDAIGHSELKSDVVVHRGIRRPEDVFGDKWSEDVTGMEWQDPAYTSTSAAESVAVAMAGGDLSRSKQNPGVVMNILVPKGSHGIQGSPAKMGDGTEAELLLARGGKFRVIADHGVIDGHRRLDVEMLDSPLPERLTPSVAPESPFVTPKTPAVKSIEAPAELREAVARTSIADLREQARKEGIKVPASARTKQQIVNHIAQELAKREAVKRGMLPETPAKKVAPAKAVSMPRSSADLLKAIRADNTRAGAHKEIASLTIPQLKQFAKDHEITVSGSKAHIQTAIVEWAVGRRLDSDAITRAGSGKSVPAGPKMSTAPLMENKWGNTGGAVNFHEDGDIGLTISRLGEDKHLEVDGVPLADNLGMIATNGVRGSLTSQQVVDEIKDVAKKLPEGSKARRLVDGLAAKLDAPARPPLDMPKGTPTALKHLMEDFSKIPLARRQDASDPSEMDKLQALSMKLSSGEIRQSRLTDELRRELYNNRHESKEGKFEIDRVVQKAIAALEKKMAADREARRSSQPVKGEAVLATAPATLHRAKEGHFGNYEGEALDAPEGAGTVRALSEYEGVEFDTTNKFLRGQYRDPNTGKVSTGEEDFLQGVQERIVEIDKTMKVSRLTSDVEVHRGVKNGLTTFGDAWVAGVVDLKTTDFDEQDRQYERWQAGERPDLTGLVFTDKGFTSTTADPKVADDFVKHRLGTPDPKHPGGVTYGLEGEPVVMSILVPKGTGGIQLAEWGNAAEVLLERGLSFEVIKDNGVDDKGYRRLVVRVVQT